MNKAYKPSFSDIYIRNKNGAQRVPLIYEEK